MVLEDINKDIEILKLETKIESQVAKELDETQKEFVLREKVRVIKEELGEAFDKDFETDLLRERIDKLKCGDKVRKRLNLELARYNSTNPNSPELGIIRTYIDWLLTLPWEKSTKDEEDLNKVKESLDKNHYALDSVKDRVIEYLAVKQNKNTLRSPIFCLVGPPGVGKTTLLKALLKVLEENS